MIPKKSLDSVLDKSIILTKTAPNDNAKLISVHCAPLPAFLHNVGFKRLDGKMYVVILKILHTAPQCTTWKYSYIRAVVSSGNLEGGKYLWVGHNLPLPPMVDVELTDLSKSGWGRFPSLPTRFQRSCLLAEWSGLLVEYTLPRLSEISEKNWST